MGARRRLQRPRRRLASRQLLLNPEGFEHALFSEDGSLILVRLRQYPGSERVAVGAAEVTASPETWGDWRLLPGSGRTEGIARIRAGETFSGAYADGVEVFVLNGDVAAGDEALTRHDWLRLPAGQTLVLDAGADAEADAEVLVLGVASTN